jgi:ribosome-binding protein aMBF1 (putative translation factor)
MNMIIAEELLNDPIALAIAVLVDRVRSLPKEDRNDLFELTEALAAAQTEEEQDAATRGMREILQQQRGCIRPIEPTDNPSDELRRWMDYAGGRIRHCREQVGLTQAQLAEKAGLRQSHISRLEKGHHSPSFLTLEKLSAALGISVSDLDPSAP